MSTRVLVPQRVSARAPAADSRIDRFAGRGMGCPWSVTWVDEGRIDRGRVQAGIEAVLARVIEQMSTWEPQSLISRFNHAAPGSWLPLPLDFALVLGCALQVARASDGALDPTSGELVSLWGFGASGRHHEPGFSMPQPEQVTAALQRCGWRRLQVDTAAMRLHQPGGLQLDLSAVAKGFAVDEVGRFLRSEGITHHLVDIGGELRGAGMKPDGQPWWVQVQLPPGAEAILPTRIALHGLSVATSGDYLQAFSTAGRRYSHCIDPRSGYPVDNGVCAVTVLHAECMLADAWSTALMVLGARAGMAVAETEKLAAQWIERVDGGVVEHCSSAFRALIA
ncbi:MAG TPA: FAD:protein FMN transferase [Steroidobacteraceae bacterium]|nr:FAD:protein FMN transferase [Steroidobacteraceae bacterium]